MGTRNRLNALKVERAKGSAMLADGGGLYLEVRHTGFKGWLFRYSVAGKEHWHGLGPLHLVTLIEAREKADECRRLLRAGVDPILHRRAAGKAEAAAMLRAIGTKAMTFDTAAAQYIEAHRVSWRNEKHVAQWESTLRTYCSPVFGAMPVAAIDTALVVKALAPIWSEKTETATRLRGRIESVLAWSITMGYRDPPNPATWKNHLDNLLASPTRTKRVEHFAALHYAELPELFARLQLAEGMGARALAFAILTACRSGEVRLAAWPEIDIEQRLWTIPADRMKAGREHRVPLSEPAIELLADLPRDGDLVFPGARAGRPLSDMSLSAVLRRMDRNDITVHGFRSTFRDWCADTTSFPREVCEHALAHQLPDKVEAAYRRSDLIDKRRLLMEQWGLYCTTPRLPAAVVPLRSTTAACR